MRSAFFILTSIVFFQAGYGQTINPSGACLQYTVFSNPSGYDYLTQWVYYDSSATVLVENNVLEIITHTSNLGKPKGSRPVDSTTIVIKINVDIEAMRSVKTIDNRDHEIGGTLTYQGIEYPVKGSWAFSEKNRKDINSLYLNLTIGHAKDVHIPITLPQLRDIVLTDFVFQTLDAFVDEY